MRCGVSARGDGANSCARACHPGRVPAQTAAPARRRRRRAAPACAASVVSGRRDDSFCEVQRQAKQVRASNAPCRRLARTLRKGPDGVQLQIRVRRREGAALVDWSILRCRGRVPRCRTGAPSCRLGLQRAENFRRAAASNAWRLCAWTSATARTWLPHRPQRWWSLRLRPPARRLPRCALVMRALPSTSSCLVVARALTRRARRAPHARNRTQMRPSRGWWRSRSGCAPCCGRMARSRRQAR
jgi:hypothetical protein